VYIPSSFRVESRATLFEFVERYGFATLVSDCGGVPYASHLPLLLDREGATLLGHMARANPHWKAFDGASEALAIFSGPHAYISPTWYVSLAEVPTWNYTVVHVYGIPKLLTPDRTREAVDATVQKYESMRPNPWPNELPDEYRRRLLESIVGFEMPVARIEGKFKLGQNRSSADQDGMLEGLRGGDAEEVALAEFIARHRSTRVDR
jgi:transcriptional regulator